MLCLIVENSSEAVIAVVEAAIRKLGRRLCHTAESPTSYNETLSVLLYYLYAVCYDLRQF